MQASSDIFLGWERTTGIDGKRRVLAADFVYWDDDVEIYANPHLKGITPETLRWMFFGTGYVVRYQPLTWLTCSTAETE